MTNHEKSIIPHSSSFHNTFGSHSRPSPNGQAFPQWNDPRRPQRPEQRYVALHQSVNSFSGRIRVLRKLLKRMLPRYLIWMQFKHISKIWKSVKHGQTMANHANHVKIPTPKQNHAVLSHPYHSTTFYNQYNHTIPPGLYGHRQDLGTCLRTPKNGTKLCIFSQEGIKMSNGPKKLILNKLKEPPKETKTTTKEPSTKKQNKNATSTAIPTRPSLPPHCDLSGLRGHAAHRPCDVGSRIIFQEIY